MKQLQNLFGNIHQTKNAMFV